MRAAFSTVIVDGYALAEGLDILAGSGVAEVEPAYIAGYTPFSEETFTARSGAALAGLAAASGLTVPALSAHVDLGGPDSATRLLRRLDFALALGARTVISNATAQPREGAFRITLDRVLPEFEAAGVTLAIENPGHGRDALLPDGAAGAALVAAVGHPALRLNYDIGNAVTYSHGRIDPARDLAAALPAAARIHLKDVAESGGDWAFCPIGQGMVGYGRRVLAGPVAGLPPATVEHPLRLHRPGRGDPVRCDGVPSRAEISSAVAASLAALVSLGSSGVPAAGG